MRSKDERGGNARQTELMSDACFYLTLLGLLAFLLLVSLVQSIRQG